MTKSRRFQLQPRYAARFWGTVWFRFLPALLLLLTAFLLTPSTIHAQPDDDEEETDLSDIPLIERDYFDRITLDERNRNEVYEIQKVTPPPSRPKPETGFLRFRRIEVPLLLFEVPWKNVVKFETFPEMILDEAIRKRDSGDLDGAFEFFAFLVNNYPDAPNLDREINTLLYFDMTRLFKAGKYSETLAVLEELYARDPNYKPPDNRTPLQQALDGTLDKILEGYLQSEDFASVRDMLARIKATYGDEQKSVVDRYNAKLLQLATESRDDVERYIAADKEREAHTAVRRMLDILPTIQGGRELKARVMKLFPLVMVGVGQQAFSQDPVRIDYWAAKRAGHLAHRTLLEYASRGEEGGRYASLAGTFELSEDGTQFSMDVGGMNGNRAAPQVTGYDVSRRLISLANPSSDEFLPPWNRLVKTVRLDGVNRVTVELRFPHVLPEAYLRIPVKKPEGDKPPVSDGIYVGSKPAGGEVTFDLNPIYSFEDKDERPKIVERYFGDPDQAVRALKKGEIDVIDRVYPAEIPTLERDPNIIVEPYQLPTVHMLIPNPRSPFMKNVNFRRALTYGINRQMILHDILLANRTVEGCRNISGPFPAGVSDADAFAYAYNERILPYPYEPWLAYKLIAVAEKQLEKDAIKNKKEPPKKPELVLAYPAGHVSQIACDEIVRHLASINLKCKLVELPEGVTRDPDGKYDLLYVELSMWEPLVEARKLFKTSGLIRETTSHIDLALWQLESARNWSQARRRLYELHSLSHFDAVVIPLWQVLDHVAYRKGLTGVGENLLTLYQNAADWRISVNGASPEDD